MATTTIEPINNYGTYRRRGADRAGTPEPRRAAGRPSVGRYDGRTHNVRRLDGVGQMPASRNADTIVAAVVDPYGDGQTRIAAGINRRVDILEYERSRGLISEAAYRIGREVQDTFQRMASISGTNWAGASRGDPGETRENRIIKTVEHAAAITKLVDHMQCRIGMRGARLIRRMLGDGLTFAQCAGLEGKSGDRGQTYVAQRYREALEDYSETRVSKGSVKPARDKHSEAAKAVEVRRRKFASETE